MEIASFSRYAVLKSQNKIALKMIDVERQNSKQCWFYLKIKIQCVNRVGETGYQFYINLSISTPENNLKIPLVLLIASIYY